MVYAAGVECKNAEISHKIFLQHKKPHLNNRIFNNCDIAFEEWK